MATRLIKLIIHPGLPKCGSTTIQAILANNRDKLYRLGVGLLSSSDCDVSPDNRRATLGASSLFDDLYARRIKPHAISQRIIDLLVALDEAQMTTAILSAENLGTTNKHTQQLISEVFSPIRQHAKLHAVFYVRRQDELLKSSWKQWEGKVVQSDFVEYVLHELDHLRFDFYHIADFWRNLTGDNSAVNILDPSFLSDRSLWADFCQACQLPTEALSWGEGARPLNVSPPDSWLKFLFDSQEVMFSGMHDTRVFSLLELIAGPNPPWMGTRGQNKVSEKQRAYIMTAYAQVNRRFVEKYFCDDERAERAFDLEKESAVVLVEELRAETRAEEMLVNPERGFKEITALSLFYVVERLQKLTSELRQTREQADRTDVILGHALQKLTTEVRRLREQSDKTNAILGHALELVWGDKALADEAAHGLIWRCSGYVDEYNGERLWGWLRLVDLPWFHPLVALYLDGQQAGLVRADMVRADLKKAGEFDGRYGFEFLLPPNVSDDQVLSVRIHNTHTEVPGSGKKLREYRIRAMAPTDAVDKAET